MPIILCFIKGIGKTAPTRILCKYLLLLGCCQTVIELKLVQEVDRRDVLSELLFCSTHSDLVIGNAVVVLLAVGYLGMRVIHGQGFSRLCFFHKLRNTGSVFLVVLFDEVIRYRNKSRKIKVAQLMLDKVVKRVIFAYFYDVIGKILFDLEVNKVCNYLNGDLIIGNSRITDTDVCQIGKIHRFGIVLLGTIVLNELLRNLKLCRFPARYFDNMRAILLGKRNNVFEGFLVDTDTFHGGKVFVKRDSIVQKELIEVLSSPLVISVRCNDPVNVEIHFHVVHFRCVKES